MNVRPAPQRAPWFEHRGNKNWPQYLPTVAPRFQNARAGTDGATEDAQAQVLPSQASPSSARTVPSTDATLRNHAQACLSHAQSHAQATPLSRHRADAPASMANESIPTRVGQAEPSQKMGNRQEA